MTDGLRVIMSWAQYRRWQRLPGYTRDLDIYVMLPDGTRAETLPDPPELVEPS